MFYYFRRINRKINDTLNIYQDIGKLGVPFFKYVLILLSFLISISSIALFFSLFVENSVNLNANSIWINYSLPIIIYGVITPLLSTLVSLIFKLFLELNIDNIINKYKYLRKKNGTAPKILIEFLKIVTFIITSKISKISKISKTNIFIIASSLLLILLLILIVDTIITVIVLITVLICYILITLIEYYDNSIDCYISSIEKCSTNQDCYWRYNIYIKYPHEEKRAVKKRFNDFKQLHNDLELPDELPTSYWIKPLQIAEAEERGRLLNSYLKRLLTNNNNALSNTIFYNFFKEPSIEDKIDSALLVLERKPIEIKEIIDKTGELTEFDTDIIDDIDYNNILKNQLNPIINKPINTIYILYELNYYTTLKKRFFVLCDDTMYKLKYNKFINAFSIRDVIYYNKIYKIEKTKLTNTIYFKDKEILIIKFIQNRTRNQYILSSLSNDKYYNISNLYTELSDKLDSENCYKIVSDGFTYDNGYGISETIQNNSITKNIKKMLIQNILYSKKYLRYIWK